jgi:hypothetical protein
MHPGRLHWILVQQWTSDPHTSSVGNGFRFPGCGPGCTQPQYHSPVLAAPRTCTG